jgi:hypothetical protein
MVIGGNWAQRGIIRIGLQKGSGANAHAISAFIETIDNAGGNGSFIEGIRSHAVIMLSGKLFLDQLMVRF